MNFSEFAAYMNEVNAWYGKLPALVDEDRQHDAKWVVDLFAANITEVQTRMAAGNMHGLPTTLQGMKGIFSKSHTGSILNLRGYPELLAQADAYYQQFDVWCRDMKDFNGSHQQGLNEEDTKNLQAAATRLKV